MPKVGDIVTEIIDDPDSPICSFTTVYVEDPDPQGTFALLTKMVADRLWEAKMRELELTE